MKSDLQTNGQKIPVVVRKKGQSYLLVTGFRRHAALTAIAKETGDKNMTILCEVKDLDDLSARIENISENGARQDITAPDLCWGLKDIMAEYEKKNVMPTQQQLAEHIGKTQSYTGKLQKICNDLHPDLMTKWRTSPIQIPVMSVLAVAKKSKNEQKEAWDKMMAQKDKPKPTDAEKAKKKVESVMAQAESSGFMLGSLNYLEVVSFKEKDITSDPEAFAQCVDVPENFTAGQRKRVTNAFLKGVESGKRGDAFEGEEEEETEEE